MYVPFAGRRKQKESICSPMGRGQLSLFCLAALFSLVSLNVIIEFKLDIFQKMCTSSHRDEGLLKA